MRLRKLGRVATAIIAAMIFAGAVTATPRAQAQASGDTVLTIPEATKLLPASVYFRGQSATTQLRYSNGVKLSDGMYILSVPVDTSGYSTAVQQKYQDYFITEVPIKIEGHDLPAGIYGVGFIGGDKFIVLDVGAHDLFIVDSHTDTDLKRPVPLKIIAADKGFRLYAGRRYITFAR
jgi:hypothetical protein